MTRWLGMAALMLWTAMVACNQAAPGEETRQVGQASERSDLPMSAGDRGPEAQAHARTADQAAAGCPHAQKKLEAANDDGCSCGKAKGSCPHAQGQEGDEGCCAGCEHAGEGEQQAGCACADDDGASGCPHARPPAAAKPEAKLDGVCPYLSDRARQAGRPYPHRTAQTDGIVL